MGLEFIPNQPFVFGTRNETQACKKDDAKCALIADGDEFYIQAINEPCEGPILCDSDFTADPGTLVTNGDFPTGSAGWTLGATWTWNAGGYMDVFSGVAMTAMSQTIAAGLNSGECYVLVFTISNYVSGTLMPNLGGTNGTAVSADGTYRQVIIPGAGGDLTFTPTTTPNEMSIDGIELYSMGFCWCPDNGNLEHGSQTMCHVPGAATVLTQVGVVPPIVSGNYYKVQVTITGRTAGSVHYVLGAAAVSDDFAGNGTFTDYVFADANNNFEIHFSSDFDGCITDILVYEMTTDIDFGVLNYDGTLAQELNGVATFQDNRVTWHFDTDDFTFSHGCYRFWVLDPCDPSPEVQESNCFTWQASWPGTKQVISTDYISGDVINTRYSFGFQWTTTAFYLIQRVYLHFRKPRHNNQMNTDRFSTGEHFKSYVETSKNWEMAIESLDEDQHDCMRIQWQCRSVSIDGVEYFTEEEEYSPLWDEGGYLSSAPVKFTVMRKQDVLFRDNCNR